MVSEMLPVIGRTATWGFLIRTGFSSGSASPCVFTHTSRKMWIRYTVMISPFWVTMMTCFGFFFKKKRDNERVRDKDKRQAR